MTQPCFSPSYAGNPENEDLLKKACSPGFIIEQYNRAKKKLEEFEEFFAHKYEKLKEILAPEEE